MWKYFGVFCNTFTVVLGSCIGLILRSRAGRGKPGTGTAGEEKLSDKMMECMGFVTVFAAASGLLEVESSVQALICVASMVIGFASGWLLKLNDRLDSLGEQVQARFAKADGSGKNPAEGMVTATLLFCVGSMTVLGSFESAANPAGGLELGCHTTLLIKSLMDFTSSTCLAVTYGASVILAGGMLLVIQGGLVFLASTVQPFLLRINAMPMINCVGSLLLLGIALNLLGIKKIKTADYLPALFVPILACWLITALGGSV